MPTYEYVCTSCRRRTEAVQSFHDAPLTTCESCGGPLKRVFHPVGIVLKGSGFYSTDNRGKSKGATKEKDAAKSETTSESAPAAKPETAPKPKPSGGTDAAAS